MDKVKYRKVNLLKSMDFMKPKEEKGGKKGNREKGESDSGSGSESGFFSDITNYVKNINDSKIFAGLMIIILNVSSKFVNIKLSKTVESYLKNSFSRTILVFAIAWMGTRDLWVALGICLIFTFLMDYLWNEESMFCILPETFTDYHVNLLNDEKNCKVFTKEDVEKAIEVLRKAKDILDRSQLSGINPNTDSTIQDQKKMDDLLKSPSFLQSKSEKSSGSNSNSNSYLNQSAP
jgi:hypothetical protein